MQAGRRIHTTVPAAFVAAAGVAVGVLRLCARVRARSCICVRARRGARTRPCLLRPSLLLLLVLVACIRARMRSCMRLFVRALEHAAGHHIPVQCVCPAEQYLIAPPSKPRGLHRLIGLSSNMPRVHSKDRCLPLDGVPCWNESLSAVRSLSINRCNAK